VTRFASHSRDQASLPRRKLDRKELAALARKNAEDLLMELCGKKYQRAYNPDCAPKTRRRFK
jgi:hypothetical protein